MRTHLFILVILLSITACDTYADRPIETSKPITADQALIEKVQKSGWLEKNCNIYFKFMSGEEFKQCIQVQTALLEPYDAKRRHEFGKDYDPEKYYQCRLSNNRASANCEKYKLVRDEPKPVWPYPDVPAIQWPEAPEEPTYKDGMSREEYFTALCEREAGEFIYTTVDNVEGVYQIRPRYPERTLYMQDPYVMEDPVGYDFGESDLTSFNFLKKDGYRFYETSLYDPYKDVSFNFGKKLDDSLKSRVKSNDGYLQYFIQGDESLKSIKRKHVTKISSQYVYVWRGIERYRDRELGIAGSELAVVDLNDNALLAIRRGFALSVLSKDKKTWWLGAIKCNSGDGEKFIKKVLTPKVDRKDG